MFAFSPLDLPSLTITHLLVPGIVMAMAQLHQYRLGFSLLMPVVGMATGALQWNSAATFILNTVALIPLGSWINRSVDSLSVDGTRVVNELLKSTLGNSVELMVSSGESAYKTKLMSS